MKLERHGNLVGQVFNRWTVVSKCDISPSGSRMWLCRCICGTEREVDGRSLYKGYSKSCGCLHKEIMQDRFEENLIGKRFGKLVVIEQGPSSPSGYKRYYCLCDCGKTTLASVKRGTKSCGCLNREVLASNYIDLKGQIFGRLTVIDRDLSSDKKKYICECTCGNIKSILQHSLISGDTQSCGCLHKEIVSVKRDLTGLRFGRWSVIKECSNNLPYRVSTYLCRCDCGTEKIVTDTNLVGNKSVSCGCYALERHTKHGLSRTKDYVAYQSKKQREKRNRVKSLWTTDMEKSIRKLQPSCVICGMTEEDHYSKYNKNLHVDHVLPNINYDGSVGQPLYPGNAVVLCQYHNCSKSNKNLNSLPIEWQASIIWNAIQFKNYWESLQDGK